MDQKTAYFDWKVRKGYQKLNLPTEGVYKDRLEYELESINRMGFADYFLIIADLVDHVRATGTYVGPGRGSCCGSLVCYAMGITTIDPIRFGLLFERFLNPGRFMVCPHDVPELTKEEWMEERRKGSKDVPAEFPKTRLPGVSDEVWAAADQEWFFTDPDEKLYLGRLRVGMVFGKTYTNKLNSPVLAVLGLCPGEVDLEARKKLLGKGGGAPDIDLDFEPVAREGVFTYLIEKYGADRVSRIGAFGTMQTRSAIRDCARAFNIRLEDADRVSKMFPAMEHDFDKAVSMVESLQEEKDKNPAWFAMAKKLSGKPRSASAHPAGILVAPSAIVDHMPMAFVKIGKAEEKALVTQWDMKDIEDTGFLKIDALGLNNLAVIHRTVDRIKRDKGIDIDVESFDLEDPGAVGVIAKGRTCGLFQLERRYVQALCRDMNMTCFEDVVYMAAIIRPGTADAGTIKHFMDRRSGVEKTEYIDASLEDTLAKGMGYPIFQEDVMKMVQVYAGFTLAEADKLRRAVAKKKPKEMIKVKKLFMDKSQMMGRDMKKSEEVFEYIEYFSAYGFNASHATSYSKITMQCAHLKHYYPVEYMCELLNGELESNEPKTEEYLNECRVMGMKILPPLAGPGGSAMFAPDGQGNLRFGLAFIKGVSVAAAEEAVRATSSAPGWLFCDWLPLSKGALRSNAIEAIILAGAFSHLGIPRNVQLARYQAVAAIVKKIKDQRKRKDEGVKVKVETSIDEARFAEENAIAAPMTAEEVLKKEYELCGAYVTHSPTEPFLAMVDGMDAVSLYDLEEGYVGDKVKAMALLSRRMEHIITKKGKNHNRKMLFLTLADGPYTIEAPVFPDSLELMPDLEEGAVYLFDIERKKGKCNVTAALRLSSETPVAEVAK